MDRCRHCHSMCAKFLSGSRQENRGIYIYFYVERTVHFGMKLYNDERNAQVFNLFICLLLPYTFRGVLLAHLQRQVYNFGSGSSLGGMESAVGRRGSSLLGMESAPGR
jgi:hypothetical protein